MMTNSSAKEIARFLQPECSNLKSKVMFFSMAEGWVEADLEEQEKKIFCFIKSEYTIEYYWTLYHLLNCPVCLNEYPDMLTKYSHPELWKIGSREPEEYHQLLESNENSEQLRYFRLFYKNLIKNETQKSKLFANSKKNIKETLDSFFLFLYTHRYFTSALILLCFWTMFDKITEQEKNIELKEYQLRSIKLEPSSKTVELKQKIEDLKLKIIESYTETVELKQEIEDLKLKIKELENKKE